MKQNKDQIYLKSFFIKSIFLIFLLMGAAESKPLPPGTGVGDVPSNVLILIDKSGSMSSCMPGGDYFCRPWDLAVDDAGDLYSIGYYNLGIAKLKYENLKVDTAFADNGVYSLQTAGCYAYNDGWAYGLIEHHDGYIYSANFIDKYIVKIDASTGECIRKFDLTGSPHGMTMRNGHLFIVVKNKGITSINLDTETVKACGVTTSDPLDNGYGITVDNSMANLYVYARNNQIRQYIYRFALSSDGTNYCNTSSTHAARWSGDMPGGYMTSHWAGIEMHPTDDSKIFMVGWGANKLGRATINAAKNGFSFDWIKGNRRNAKSSVGKTPNFWHPFGLTIDQTNERIFTSGLNSGYVQIFDFDGNYIKQTDDFKSRLDGVKEAIKSVVQDTSIAAGINFGYGYWSHLGNANFSGWRGTTEDGQQQPCWRENCIKVGVSKVGGQKIVSKIDSLQPGGGTNAIAFSRLAKQYYEKTSINDSQGKKVCPIDTNLSCQKSYVVVIGDGDFFPRSSEAEGKTNIAALATGPAKALTIMVGYGPGISAQGKVVFNEMAVLGDPQKIMSKGDTPTALFPSTPKALKSQLTSLLQTINAQKFSFTAPSISATIEEGGSLYQATFEYKQSKEWQGDLKRIKISNKGILDRNDSSNWSARDMLPNPSARNIWTVLPNNTPGYTDTIQSGGNFKTSNSVKINDLFGLTGNVVQDFHRVTAVGGSLKNARCKTSAGVVDGISDDILGLIGFIRGTDYYDYNGNCDLTETRVKPFGDIYHSELVVVGKPNAETSFKSTNQEAYWRNLNNYQTFAQDNNSREEVIYTGSNSGVLHAFNAITGKEIWAFVPPLIAAKLPEIINTALNASNGGGTNAIFGVDGSATVHDMFFTHPIHQTKRWATVLIIPYGRGGAGFSVLDVTNPRSPLHLYSIFNDEIKKIVHLVDHDGLFQEFPYIAKSYSISNFIEARDADFNKLSSKPNTCTDTKVDGQFATTCWESTRWIFPVENIIKSDITIEHNGSNYTNFSVFKDSNDQTIIQFGEKMTYQADGDASEVTSSLIIRIKDGTVTGTKGVKGQLYDYSSLAETWSSPRIFRMPNTDAPDENITDDIYVAVMGAGMGVVNPDVGSSLFVINLEDTTNIGKVEKEISITDLSTSDIDNSTPATPTVVTADTGTTGIRFTGALVYQSDLEGKITKINLTNMKCDDGSFSGTCSNGSSDIKRFDQTTLFQVGSSNANGRFMYHALEATLGATTPGLWLYNSTGDFARVNDATPGVENILFGIRDRYFPKFKFEKDALSADDLTDCKDTTGDRTKVKCPTSTDRGWFIKLKDFAKGTAEPTAYGGRVYFPIYKPTDALDKCALGKAYICGVDDECGTNVSINELKASDQGTGKNSCKYVGEGVLSKIIVFANKLFANISGVSINEEDIVSIDTGQIDSVSMRNSWRQNY